MIIKLLKATVVNGVKHKKGSEIVVTRAKAIELCQDEKAVAPIDVPCHKRSEKKEYKEPAKTKETEGN